MMIQSSSFGSSRCEGDVSDRWVGTIDWGHTSDLVNTQYLEPYIFRQIMAKLGSLPPNLRGKYRVIFHATSTAFEVQCEIQALTSDQVLFRAWGIGMRPNHAFNRAQTNFLGSATEILRAPPRPQGLHALVSEEEFRDFMRKLS